jgi:hypothetical protein
MKGLFLLHDDLVGVLRYSIFEAIVITRQIFMSNLVLIKFSDESHIEITNNVSLLSEIDIDNLSVIDKIHNTKNWRIKLILESPYMGAKFIKLWDAGKFKVICRERNDH